MLTPHNQPQSNSPAISTSEFVHYLDPALPLEARLDAAIKDYDLDQETIAAIRPHLESLKEYHLPTYEHSIRVALVAANIASAMQLDPRALLIAGLLHDIGKTKLPLTLLNYQGKWGSEQELAMRDHAMLGYDMVKDRFAFAADIMVRHHTFQGDHSYPQDLPPYAANYSRETQASLGFMSRLFALADTYDALHRKNDRNNGHGNSGEEIKQFLLTHNPDLVTKIEDLYRTGVLTTFIHGAKHTETEQLDTEDTLHESCFHERYIRMPDDTARQIAIATSLEPVFDKPGCTTRFKDVSRHLKLEYFVTAGINISSAFARLAHTAYICQGTDLPLYMHVYEAQLDSKKNRRGGRINQGMIELLAPIVIAQHQNDFYVKLSGEEILGLATKALAKSSRRDVDNLVEMKKLAYQLSHYSDRDVPKYEHTKSVAEYYKAALAQEPSATSRAHNGEFVLGFPTVELMYKVLRDSPYPHLNMRIKDAWARARHMHEGSVSPGFLADCIAAALYLRLSQHPTERIIG